MHRPEFVALCRGVEDGSERYVEETLTHSIGKVVACAGNHFEVEVNDRHESWPRESCREKWGYNP